MKSRQRIQKSDVAPATDPEDKDKPKHRLTGISVDEVSIVDRAANKRNYLIVKRDGVLHVEKDGAPPPPAGNAPAPPAPPTTPAPPTLRISPELKAKVAGILRTAQERIGIISKVLEGSSETPGAPPPKELMDALAQLAALINADAQPPAQQPPAQTPPASPPPAAAAKDETQKAGRKLSGARIKQLTEMRSTLDALISDVSNAPKGEAGDDDESEEKKPAEKSGDPETPLAGDPPKKSDDEEEKKKEPPAAPVTDPETKAELTEIKQSLAGITDLVSKMTTLYQAQNARVEELSKSRGVSQQKDVDTPVAKKDTRVVWDLDMAKPAKTIQ